jgi:putative membrane protein
MENSLPSAPKLPSPSALSTPKILWLALFFGLMLWSGIAPADRFTWVLEVFPAWIVFIILALTYKRYPLTQLAYSFILIHASILYLGGHYTYAEVPLGYWMKDLFHFSRNNYDKIGHLAQGFIPALVLREIFIRSNVVNSKGWRFSLVVASCLAFSAFYEILEFVVAISTGDKGDAFLGTQGYVWDTQTDMLAALIGAILCQILFARIHDGQIKNSLTSGSSTKSRSVRH